MKNAQNNNAVNNQNVKEMSTMKTNNATATIRKIAAQPTGWGAVAAFAVGEALTKVTKAIAGDQYKTMKVSRYLDKRATGSVFGGFDLEAAFAAVEAKKEEKADHSDMVEWKKGRWVPSAKAQEAAKKNGHEQAFLPQMYKAANWIIRVAKEGGDKVYSTAQGETHTYLGWTFKAVFGHASFMEGKGVKNAKSPEKLAEYFETACKHSRVAEDKLPTWEEVCAAVQAEQKLAKEEAVAEERITVEEGKAIIAEADAINEEQEARDGRAPKKAATPKKRVNEAIHSLGFSRLTKKAAFEIAQKAAEAAENGEMDLDMRDAVISACIAKDGGDPEEFYVLMGQN